MAPPAKAHPDVTFHAKPKPLPAGAVTHDWKSFLGPTHNAVSTETKLLAPGRGGPTLVWEMRKGTGYSSPAIAGDRLVFIHRVGGEELVECLHPETGERYWQFAYPTQFEDRYGYNNGPRASPVIDGDRVYTYGAEGKLHCLRARIPAKLSGSATSAAEFNVPQDFFGTASTPLVEGRPLIINVGAPAALVAAFDKPNGKMVWGAGEEWGPSYASPVPAIVHGKRRVFVFAGGESRPPTGGLLSIDPATGKSTSRSLAQPQLRIGERVLPGHRRQSGFHLGQLSHRRRACSDLLPDGSHKVAWTIAGVRSALEHADPSGRLPLRLRWPQRARRRRWRASRRRPARWCGGRCPSGPRPSMAGEGSSSSATFRGSLLAVDGRYLCLGELGHLLWLDLTPKGYRESRAPWLFPARKPGALPVLSRGLLYVSQHSRDIVGGRRRGCCATTCAPSGSAESRLRRACLQ